jgi:hypothetical protein
VPPIVESISKFLARVEFPLHNTRWSRGARSDLGVLVTKWADDLHKSGHFVRVLGWRSQAGSPAGLNERMDHLRTLWSGGLAGYVVVATAQDTRRSLERFSPITTRTVRAIVSLVAKPDVRYGQSLVSVPIKRLNKHAAHLVFFPAEAAFPIERVPSEAFKATSAAYIAKHARHAPVADQSC